MLTHVHCVHPRHRRTRRHEQARLLLIGAWLLWSLWHTCNVPKLVLISKVSVSKGAKPPLTKFVTASIMSSRAAAAGGSRQQPPSLSHDLRLRVAVDHTVYTLSEHVRGCGGAMLGRRSSVYITEYFLVVRSLLRRQEPPRSHQRHHHSATTLTTTTAAAATPASSSSLPKQGSPRARSASPPKKTATRVPQAVKVTSAAAASNERTPLLQAVAATQATTPVSTTGAGTPSTTGSRGRSRKSRRRVHSASSIDTRSEVDNFTSGPQWTVLRRYSRFVALHRRLKAVVPRSLMPRTPRPRHHLGSFKNSSRVEAERKISLQVYINEVLALLPTMVSPT